MQSVDFEKLLQTTKAFCLEEHHERILDRQRDSRLGLVVMVVGEGNFGKSSLVNALCGKEVAPVAIIPKTFKIDVHRKAELDEAHIRYLGSTVIEIVSHAEARERSEQAERAAKRGEKVDLAEIIWHHRDIAIPDGLAIVDTPGISQALGGSAKSVSLTQVLGSTFEVDEVWAQWFHRADIVLWGFSANKMQSSETKNALDGALKLFEKHIVPIATKADVISRDRWPEIEEHFYKGYSPLLSSHRFDPLRLTVCGGKSEFVGFGVQELRDRLNELLVDHRERKRQVDEQFVIDISRSVSDILHTTALELVTNLRTIASLGDALAIEALKVADRAEKEACASIGSYFGSLRQSSTISEIAQRIHATSKGGRSGNIELLCREELEAFVDKDRISHIVNDTFSRAGTSLESVGRRLSAGSSISRMTFTSSGKKLKTSLDLDLLLNVRGQVLRSNFAVKFKGPQGFWEGLLDFVSALFGGDRFTANDIEKALSDAMVIDYEGIKAIRHRVLFNDFACGIRDAVNDAIHKHLREVDCAAIEKLKLVDEFLPNLATSGGGAVCTFGPQGEYWSNLNPAVETLLNLAREELTRLLPEFRVAMQSKVHIPAVAGSLPAKDLWKLRKVRLIEDPVRLIRLSPFLRMELLISVQLKVLLNSAYVGIWSDEQRKPSTQNIAFLTEAIGSFRNSLEKHPIVLDLDRRLNDATTGVKYSHAGEKLVNYGVEALRMAINDSQRQWQWTYMGQQCFGLLLPSTSRVIGLSLLWIGILGSVVHPLVFVGSTIVSLTWFAGNSLVPSRSFTSDYQLSVASAVTEEMRTCIAEAPKFLPDQCVNEILSGMTAELAPRPLQKLLMEGRFSLNE